jgi:hypothetical protein
MAGNIRRGLQSLSYPRVGRNMRPRLRENCSAGVWFKATRNRIPPTLAQGVVAPAFGLGPS